MKTQSLDNITINPKKALQPLLKPSAILEEKPNLEVVF
jgi:hypothetical protein